MGKNNPVENEFLMLLDEHQGILHKISLMYATQMVSKEDLYQEIILQLWKSYSSFQGRSSFSTWMYRVALNTAITTSMKKSVFFLSPRSDIAYYDIETLQDNSEEVKILYQAIARLKKIEKAIILLWLEEKSYAEIAEITGVTEKNVSVKLVRIKAKLTEMIQKLQ